MERIANPLFERTSGSPGVRLIDGGVDVSVWSHNGEKIWFCLFDEKGEREIARWHLAGRNGDIHHGFVPSVSEGARYGLRADGPWQPEQGHRFDPSKLLVDPYATRIDRQYVHHPELCASRSAGLDTANLVPRAIIEASGQGAPETECLPLPCSFIYEIGVKAFTRLHPDLPMQQRGTLAGLAHPRIIEHLIRLGVSHVELMPIAGWIDERHLPPLGLSNAWGYNPVTFMALDPRLAPGGMEDLRVAVKALHHAGIGVILDVVFNHTGESDKHGATLSLRGLDNAVYFRHLDGELVNDTGCGNTLACDQPPVMNLVLDSLRYFRRQAGVDGFRFDLAPILGRNAHGFDANAPLLRMIETDVELSSAMLIAEPWDIGPGGYQLGKFGPRWSEWNDRYRDDVRRFWRGDADMENAFAARLDGSRDIFQAQERSAGASINFIAAHDGFTLRDIVSYRTKNNLANGEDNRDGHNENYSWGDESSAISRSAENVASRDADVRALLAALILSKGIPMLTAGDEFGRTQNGNNNAYAQDNETTWLHWETADHDLIDYVKRLSAVRKVLLGEAGHLKFAANESSEKDPGTRFHIRSINGPGLLPEQTPSGNQGLLIYTFETGAVTNQYKQALLIFNRSHSSLVLSPTGSEEQHRWIKIFDSSGISCPGGISQSVEMTISRRSVLVIASET